MANLGKYEILKELGRGGFGTVYEAKDTVLGRHVALKVLHGQLTVDPSFILRFEQEARLAAQLEHPNLVPVYDFGQASGYNFIAMGLMRGGSLKDLITTQGALDPTQTKKILGELLEGLRIIHDNNIIHRDLKPANILFDQYGVARLSDLGFAKAMQSEESRSYSQSGGMVGTAAYMAPEIWHGENASELSDIYSLGCIIHEMLTGKSLFDGNTPAESMTKHLISGPQFDSELPPGWQALIEHCLEKEPSDRFPSVAVVLNYFQNQIVEPVTEVEFEDPVQVLDTFEETTQEDTPGLIDELDASALLNIDDTVEQEASHEHQEIVATSSDLASDQLASQSEPPSFQEAALNKKEKKEKKKTWLLKTLIPVFLLIIVSAITFFIRKAAFPKTLIISSKTPMATETQVKEKTVAIVVRKTETPNPKETPTATPTFKIPDAPALNINMSAINPTNIGFLTELQKFTYHTGSVQSAAWSPDNNLVASSGEEKVIRIWNADTGDQVQFLGGHTKSVNSISWSPDGKKLASGSWDGTVIVWDLVSEEKLLIFDEHRDLVSRVAWSPDGDKIASASGDKTVRIWDSQTGEVLTVLEKHDDIVSSLDWSPDGKKLVSGSFDGKIRIWDLETGELINEVDLQKGYIICLDWSSGGERIAIGTFLGAVLVWDVENEKIVRTMDRHTSYVVSVDWSPDNKFIVSGSADKSIRIWELANGQQIKVIEEFTHSVLSVSWSSDGSKIVSASEDETVRIWGIP